MRKDLQKSFRGLITTVVSAVVLLLCLFAFSSSALAAETNDLIYDGTSELTAVSDAIRQQMIARNESISIKFAADSKQFSNGATDTIDRVKAVLSEGIYSLDTITDNKERAHSGDYLKMNVTAIDYNITFTSADENYSYFTVTLNVSYDSTETMEQETEKFLAQWQTEFIDSNTFINSQETENEKKYYIVKTIFNFLGYNTIYDDVIYEESKKPGFNMTPDNEYWGQFRNSHSAYGAIFGNTTNAQGFVDPNAYNWETVSDSTGLTRIKQYNQGLSVCDGYALVAYYLCQLNGIDCQIVIGDYMDLDGKVDSSKTDAHAWNLVRLAPSNVDEYTAENTKWYHFDATYSVKNWQFLESDVLTSQNDNPTSSYPISNQYTDGLPLFNRAGKVAMIYYSHFLRGSENVVFNRENHQQILIDTDKNGFDISQIINTLDPQDYVLLSNNVNASTAWSVLTRRKDLNDYNTFENYFIVSPDKKFYKIFLLDNDTYRIEECSDSNLIVYNGYGYYYSLDVSDLAGDIEFIVDDMLLKDAGAYTFEAKSNAAEDNVVYSLDFNISPIDMSNWENYTSFKCNGEELKNNLLPDIPFAGSIISFNVEVYDLTGNKLNENAEYTLYFSDASGNPTTPLLPGKYYIVVDFDVKDDNYKNKLTMAFDIVKGDLATFPFNEAINAPYGADILFGCRELTVSSGSFSATMTAGNEYTVHLENPSAVNYTDEGYVIYTATAANPYFAEGSTAKRPYKIASQLDLTNVFKGFSTNSKYSYTGSTITPTDITIILSGKTLVQNVDYVIASYSNNVNVGTGYINVNFIGNYCGSASLSFEIIDSSSSTGGTQQGNNLIYVYNPTVNIVVADNITYSQNSITPSVSVTSDGKALVQNVDYTVSAISGDVGVWECQITGIGAHSYINTKKPVLVAPSKVTGGNNSASTKSSVKISWDSQGNNCFYEVYTYDSAKKKWTLLAVTNNESYKTSYYIKNNKKVKLKANMTVKFRVRAFYSATINGVSYEKYGAYTNINAATKPSTPKSPKAKAAKKSAKISWKKVANATGYEIQYSTNSKFKKGNKTITVSKGNTTSKTVKKLKSKKTYYVRVRAYKTVNGKKVYSAYTKTVKVKIKKGNFRRSTNTRQ